MYYYFFKLHAALQVQVLTIPPKKRATTILQIQEVPSHGESRRNTHRNYYPEIGEKVVATPMLPKKWTQLHFIFCDLVSMEGASELMAPHPSSISASAMLLNLFCPPFTMSSPTLLLLLLLLLLLQSTVTFTDFLPGPKTQNRELSRFLLLLLRSHNYFSDFPPRPKTQNCELSCFLQLLLQSRTT